MDRKSIIIVVISFVLLVAWFPLVNRYYTPAPGTINTNTTTLSTNAIAAGTNLPPVNQPIPQMTAAPTNAPIARTDVQEQTIVLENDVAKYTFTSHGGGLKLVELKKYPETVGRDKAASLAKVASVNTKAPAPVLALLGGAELQGDGIYQISSQGNTVRAEKTLPNGLHVTKTFILNPDYLLNTTVKVENRGAQPLALPIREVVIGTATPISTHDDAHLMGLHWYDGVKNHKIQNNWFANYTLGCIPGTPRYEYAEGNTNVVWASVNNQFFTIIAMPPTNALAPRVLARKVFLPQPTMEERAADPKAVLQPFGFQTAFLYPETVLAPQAAQEHSYEIYAGPKEYKSLAKLSAERGNNLDLVMDLSGFFGFFSKALLLSMNGLYSWGLSYGLAIIVITIIIKLIFWPLTAASTRSMKRMAKLQPQMKAIQEKYKEDPAKMNKKMMEFMRENKVNPAGSCLPMLLQIPVFMGFFFMIQSAIELRGASFLWAFDLSKPDTVWIIPGLNFPLNILPLIMGATQLWQIRLTPPSPGMDPVQQKIMQYMPLMFMVFLYNFSAGLTLYWTTQNLLSILQMKLTKNEPNATAAPAKAPARKK